MKRLRKYTLAMIVAVVPALLIGQFAAAEVSKEELKSISTPDRVTTPRPTARRSSKSLRACSG